MAVLFNVWLQSVLPPDKDCARVLTLDYTISLTDDGESVWSQDRFQQSSTSGAIRNCLCLQLILLIIYISATAMAMTSTVVISGTEINGLPANLIS